jgi:pSer/pThr/pTyr-binding forkhead associated (FHA) protein
MKELWLQFTDEDGKAQRVLVNSDNFFIGRHSDNNLFIPNNKLSRQHAKIEKFPEGYVIIDYRSSNGTFLNGEKLIDPKEIRNGDRIDLGGGVELQVELISEKEKAAQKKSSSSKQTNSNSASDGSIPTAVFFIAPVLVILMLICGGGVLLFFGNNDDGNKDNRIVFNDTPVLNTPDEDTPDNNSPTPKPSSSENPTNSPSPDASPTSTVKTSGETRTIEQNAASFLQRIALNDPTAFISTEQAKIVASRINSLKSSSGLAENLKAVKRDSSQFVSLAQSKGLKPQFLAIAAVAKLGNSSGNPLETAKQMLPVLSGLRVTLANNLADDNLMIIAAYEQGKAGKFKDLRNNLEALAKKNPGVNVREIRSIWFLKEQGKLTDSEFEFALRFLAIGTISQNPKEFNVNAEPVTF